MNGQLRDQPLAELVHEIRDARLSGAMRLAQGRAKAVVYFDGGEVVSALTNVRALRLAEMLKRSGATKAERVGEIINRGMSDEQAGEELVRAGLLDADELKRLRERQSAEVLRVLLQWAEGEWNFDPRVRLEGDQTARLDAPQMLVEAARHLPAEVISKRLSGAETLSPAEGVHERLTLDVQIRPTEAFILSRLYSPMTLGELLMVSGLPEEDTLRAVYALALGGLLRRESWPRVFAQEARRQARARTTSRAPEVAAEQAPEQAPVVPEAPAATEAEPEFDPRALIEELLERARGATHYEVLGVIRSAQGDEVKRAYYALARRLHPDRFRRDADDSLRQQIDAAFAKIAQAYEVLKDSGLRASYDLKLAAPSKGAGGATRPR